MVFPVFIFGAPENLDLALTLEYIQRVAPLLRRLPLLLHQQHPRAMNHRNPVAASAAALAAWVAGILVADTAAEAGNSAEKIAAEVESLAEGTAAKTDSGAVVSDADPDV